MEKLGEKEVIGENTYEGSAFVNSAIRSIEIPSTLKRIEAETFVGCNHLKDLEIPNGVEYIGKLCFSRFGFISDCGIEEIALPSTLS